MTEITDSISEDITQMANLFREGFSSVFPGEDITILQKEACQELWTPHKDIDQGFIKAVWNEGTQSIIAFLYNRKKGSSPILACNIPRRAHQEGSSTGREHDVHFARCYSKIINEDLNQAQNHDHKERERYSIFTDNRFARAISRFLPHKSHLSYKLIQLMEQSAFLKYENNHVRHWLVISDNQALTASKIAQAGATLVKFNNRPSIAQAILREKWIRAVVDHRRAILLVKPQGEGELVGLFSLPDNKTANVASPAFAPHESLIPLQALLHSNDIAMGLSANGDLFILEGNGIVFKRSQGQWRYVNYPYIFHYLSFHLQTETALPVLRMAIDLSYERKGALILILDDRSFVKKLIADYRQPSRANELLRDSIFGLNVRDWAQRQVITAAASTDGSIILDQAGATLDAACMIGKAEPEKWIAAGFGAPISMPGSRSSAAWHGSFYGCAIKVSADGPISIYKNGREVGHID